MFGLSFLYPALLLGALAAAAPILLHLLKQESAPIRSFSAVRLLQRAPEEHTRRQRLRELLLLALRVSAIVLLAVSLARPYLASGPAAPTGVTVVAVDRSFSLSSPGRFERVRTLAREAIARADAGHLVSLVAFDDDASVVVEPSLQRDAVRAAVSGLATGFGATNYRRALERAVAAMGPHRGSIVFITDLQQTGWRTGAEGAVPDGVDVSVLSVGGLPSNLALAALMRESTGLVAVVRNGGAGVRRGRVRLTVGQHQVADLPFEVGPASSVEVAFAGPAPTTGAVRAAIEDASGYPADDARFLVLDPPPPVSVAVITTTGDLTRDAFFVQQAAESFGEVRRFRLQGLRGSDVGVSAEPFGSCAVVMLLSTRGLDRRAGARIREFVAGGGALLVPAGDDVDQARLATLVGDTMPVARGPVSHSSAIRFAPVDPRHPVVRAFGASMGSLGHARFDRTETIDDPAWRPIARFTSGAAALVERDMGRGRVMVLASDLRGQWNDFPTQPVFVPFLGETLRYLAGDQPAPTAYLVSATPAGLPRRPGIVSAGNPSRTVAINVDPRESDPARMTEGEFLASIGRTNGPRRVEPQAEERRVEAGQGYWRFTLALVLLLLIAESLLGRTA